MSEGRQITLVTGATGFIGRHLCTRLLAEGEQVRACGRHSERGPWHEFVEIDLSKDSPEGGLFEGVTKIFHLASRAHILTGRCGSTASYRDVIVEGTRKLTAAASARGVGKFVYFSSVKAMGEGNPSDLPLSAIDESWDEKPVTPYGKAKAEAERIVLKSGIDHTVVLRPVMVFGNKQKGNLVRMSQAIEKGRFPPIPENGNRRSMVHVDDLVEYAIRSATCPLAAGKTYIIASRNPVSTRQLYDAIRTSLGLSRQAWSIPMFLLKASAATGSLLQKISGRQLPFDRQVLEKLTGSAWYSSERAQKELGFLPQHEVCEWLQESVSIKL